MNDARLRTIFWCYVVQHAPKITLTTADGAVREANIANEQSMWRAVGTWILVWVALQIACCWMESILRFADGNRGWMPYRVRHEVLIGLSGMREFRWEKWAMKKRTRRDDKWNNLITYPWQWIGCIIFERDDPRTPNNTNPNRNRKQSDLSSYNK